MSIKDSGKQEEKQGSQEPQQVTRRQFLKEASMIVGGAAIASLAFSSACVSENTTASTTASTYIPSTEGTEFLPIPGCTTFVASDRLYTIEHMWVRSIEDDKVAIGITDKLQSLIGTMSDLSLPEVGQAVTRDQDLGFVVGMKMSVEFISPVSGTVLENNARLSRNLDIFSPNVLNNDPYVTGWMLVIQLSKPEELNELLTPQEYIALNAKTDSP